MTRAEPADPLGDSIREITVLKMGDHAGDTEYIEVPDGSGNEATEPPQEDSEETPSEQTRPQEPQETKPQETIPEDTIPDTGEEDEGNDSGSQGENGGDELELDLAAVMTWYKYGNQPQALSCGPSSTVNTAQLTGSLPITMPAGASSNTYRISVSAMVKGQRVHFEIVMDCSADVSLEMAYTLRENGISVTKQIVCENTRSKTAEIVYDDQLTDGMLRYTMSLTGADQGSVSITSVTCYQSGSGRAVTVAPEGQLELLLKDGKTGENTFEIQARDAGGAVCFFTVNIPYKHRGSNNIHITTNLTDGQEIINESKTNLSVQAWSEDAGGNIISYIPANGTDTKLIVQLDGQTLSYVSSSGPASEYDLYPGNPEVGDTNTHTLYIYAEDALGNYGERTLTLKGQRREAGQKTGTATIYVDLSVLGLGVVANLSYDVLADEPISYVIAKAFPAAAGRTLSARSAMRCTATTAITAPAPSRKRRSPAKRRSIAAITAAMTWKRIRIPAAIAM